MTHAADLAVAAVEPAAPIDYAVQLDRLLCRRQRLCYAFDGSNKVGAIDQTNGPERVCQIRVQRGFGGLQAGYNYQFGSAVVGLEGDIQAADLSEQVQPDDSVRGITSFMRKSDINWFGTGSPARRLCSGIAPCSMRQAALPLRASIIVLPLHGVFTGATVDMKNDDPLIGYVVGGGIEYAITDNWTARIEYQYLKFERKTVSATEVHAALYGQNARRTKFSVGSIESTTSS